MSVPELQAEIQNQKKLYVKSIVKAVIKDPFASEHWKSEKTESQLEEYLCELLEKEDSVLVGLLIAIEQYLGK